MVASVLDLQARRSTNTDVREQFAKAVARVHLLADLHDSLAHEPEVGKINFQAYLQAVCDKLHGSIDDPDRVSLAVEAEPLHLDVSLAIPIGFVVNELVTNALKYAFPPPAKGLITISFRRQASEYLLTVKDDGLGLPQGHTVKSGGLGTRLVAGFVRQINGAMHVRHTPGVEYLIRFPAG
jgi:two-component sensor histidine kinase